MNVRGSRIPGMLKVPADGAMIYAGHRMNGRNCHVVRLIMQTRPRCADNGERSPSCDAMTCRNGRPMYLGAEGCSTINGMMLHKMWWLSSTLKTCIRGWKLLRTFNRIYADYPLWTPSLSLMFLCSWGQDCSKVSKVWLKMVLEL